MSNTRAALARVMYAEGAYCGDCEYEGWGSCGDCRRIVLSYADAILAEFEVTPRGERGQCDHERAARDIARTTTLTGIDARSLIAALAPSALPSAEDLARVRYERMRQTTPGGQNHPAWDSGSRFAEPWLADARAVLALFEKGESRG